MTTQGFVYLVGAGPGDRAYLTVRGLQILGLAEVLIYDALADPRLLDPVPETCLRLEVGKRGGEASTPQADINALLVKHCREGRRVVRLKSGDPFIFGRSSAEIQALVAAQCPFEVVPGVSSALAAPLLDGIPLTDPAMSQCFAVCTAHEPDRLNWAALAELDTVVFLMGGRSLAEIVHQLVRHGRSPRTPIAIIRWAGRPQQHTWVGTLGDIVEKTQGEKLSPTVIVVGEVVQLREFLRSPISVPQPLSNQTILVTRAAGQSSAFTQQLQAVGASVIEMPALEIRPPSSWAPLDQAIAHLRDFDWLILTSSNGVDYFFDRMVSLGRDVRQLTGIKLAVVGKKTAASLQQRGLVPDFVPPDFVADSMVEHFPEPPKGQRILFPRVESGGREVLVQSLGAAGAEVVEVAAYESGCPQTVDAAALHALQNGEIDVVTFASSKTVKHFCQLLEQAVGESWPTLVQSVAIASIGPQTSRACESALGRVDIEAQEYTLEGLTAAIAAWAAP
ncbi:uroporphyrinogen-III C-methyltransferase [Geitlerinema sp. PCC 7407]|uniref:uroporphyrinogen-III C-methyltransferase n=1 Tax=Geitlerinema sp. PCC 7407 TaxID=1173025 RepID=UPI00029F9B93|nr:uroporphyrinogen-III C-methyltransferase [Geitlerinema sp. PCC 7407]AFY64570.1 uroporphyrinogen-III C-methyltransferase, uroporphyrinogen-III synthase [Geitlerinema sp. PCC 7407]